MCLFKLRTISVQEARKVKRENFIFQVEKKEVHNKQKLSNWANRFSLSFPLLNSFFNFPIRISNGIQFDLTFFSLPTIMSFTRVSTIKAKIQSKKPNLQNNATYKYTHIYLFCLPILNSKTTTTVRIAQTE